MAATGSAVLALMAVLALSSADNGAADAGNDGYLALDFYHDRCPGAEALVKKIVARAMARAPSLAAPLLRMHFHDCFVRGCDGSVLLNSTKYNKAEKEAFPNLSLRGFNLIDNVKAELEALCPAVVSCADVLALVARDAVSAIRGPHWKVPTGRRDGVVSIREEPLRELPPPFANISTLKSSFSGKGLDAKDLAVLSGAHTIGTSHCTAFSSRLYNFTGKGDADPSLDAVYAGHLRAKCRPGDLTTLAEMDPGSFRTFDVHYYANVKKRRGLFRSDAALLDDAESRVYIEGEAARDPRLFFADFAASMEKMGRIGVLTGTAGQIRRHCAFVNPY